MGKKIPDRKKKQQLDEIMVERGLAPTLKNARALVMAGNVIVDDHRIDKPGTPVLLRSHIRIKDAPHQYVSRGGEKLVHPIEAFNIAVQNKIVLDVGASTGGFTDCLLQKGAARVFAVDVGYGQLAWKLQQDKRVVRLDRTNIRTVDPGMIQPAPHLAVIDASFISLQKILPKVLSLLVPNGEILCLVKPQFEVEKGRLGEGGIVDDPRHYREVIRGLVLECHSLSLRVIGIIESPIHGRKGNREFFLYAGKY